MLSIFNNKKPLQHFVTYHSSSSNSLSLFPPLLYYPPKNFPLPFHFLPLLFTLNSNLTDPSLYPPPTLHFSPLTIPIYIVPPVLLPLFPPPHFLSLFTASLALSICIMSPSLSSSIDDASPVHIFSERSLQSSKMEKTNFQSLNIKSFVKWKRCWFTNKINMRHLPIKPPRFPEQQQKQQLLKNSFRDQINVVFLDLLR